MHKWKKKRSLQLQVQHVTVDNSDVFFFML